MKKLDLFNTPNTREDYNNQIHSIGRIFTWVALALICAVPVAFCIAAKVVPDWGAIAACLTFIFGYWAIGLIEAFSYAPLLGTGGQYLSFITGNIANLKLPCALNSQNVAKVKQGTEEQEIVTTISIAVSSIVTTIIIVIGLIPLAIFQEELVEVLQPISPYVMPAIFGGLTMALLAKYWKVALIPFGVCFLICIIGNLIGMGSALSQSTMIIVGMVVSCISTTILYKKGLLDGKKKAPVETPAVSADVQETQEETTIQEEIKEDDVQE